MHHHCRAGYATVAATAALIISVAGTGGVAFALTRDSVTSAHIVDGSVAAADLRKGSVGRPKIRTNAVTGRKVRDRSLSGRELRPVVNGIAEAAVNVAPDGSVDASFNRLGPKPTVRRVDAGTYTVTMPGLTTLSADRSLVFVAGVAQPVSEPAECTWTGAGDEGALLVRCHDGTGDRTDSRFVLMMLQP